MFNIKKGILFLKKEGMINFFKKVFYNFYKGIKKVPNAMKEYFFGDYLLSELKKEIPSKEVYVLIPCVDWYIPIFQRPQQIATELSKKDNAIVIFISDQYKYDNFACCKRIKNNLWIFSLRSKKKLRNLTKQAKNITVFMSWTRHSDLLEYIPYNKFVYEYIDELSLFYYYNNDMEEKHRKMLEKADLIVCTAKNLYDKINDFNYKAIISENAGDYQMFHDGKTAKMNAELEQKRKNYDCVIGYYGCLAYWFDYQTILEVAKR
ncbi:MAG: hypothetical protein RR056_03750, partial [Acetivibrio sp.]